MSAPPAKQAKQDNQERVKQILVEHEAIEKIDAVQTDIDKLNEQASDDILKVEQRYNKLRQPLYLKREDFVKQIPHFWVTALVNHPQLSALLTEKDEEVMQFLTKIEVTEFDDIKSGYKISFHFDENQYFKNKVLTKEFHLEQGEQSLSAVKFEWQEGQNLVSDPSSAGEKHQLESFFSWFEETDSAAQDIGEMIKDDLWPNPLQFYLANELDEDDGEDDLDDEDELDCIDEDEDDEDGENGDDDGEEA